MKKLELVVDYPYAGCSPSVCEVECTDEEWEEMGGMEGAYEWFKDELSYHVWESVDAYIREVEDHD